MNEKLFEEYTIIESQYQVLEAKRAAMRDLILNELTTSKISSYEFKEQSFAVYSRASWTYTNAVKKMKDAVKLAEIKEQQNGKAEASMTDYLVVKQK